MRTLRKGLAMLLVVIMVLGLGAFTAVAAPADVYPDAEEINEAYKEAFDVLTYIGVFQGYEDGTIRPNDALTRVNGAKILTTVLGILNPTGTATTFTDVDDWAKGYVAFLEVNGISNGVSADEPLFGPQMELTGSMFAKWLLVGLGYNAEAEGMTGVPWEINIAKLVRATNLDAGLEDYDPTKVITRQQAAQMALNALKTPMVEYSNNVAVNAGGALVTIKDEAHQVTSGAYYATNISSAVNIYSQTLLELGEQCWKNLTLKRDDVDDMGRPCNTWAYNGKDIGTYAAISDRIFYDTKEVSKTALYNLIGKAVFSDLTDDTHATAPDYSLYVYVDGSTDKIKVGANDITVPNVDLNSNSGWSKLVSENSGITFGASGGGPGTVSISDVVTKYIENANGPSGQSGNGVVTELYRSRHDDQDIYTLVYTRSYLVQATADYSASSNNVKVVPVTDNGQLEMNGFKNEISGKDFDVSDVQKDDYLVITYSNGQKKIQSVEPAELVVGEVNSYVTGIDSGKSNVEIDGKTYSYNKAIGSGTKGYDLTFSVGSDAVIVLDQYGYVIAIDDADANASYLYVKEADDFIGSTSARVYFLDGSSKVVSVKKAMEGSTKLVAGSGHMDNKWFKYTVDGNDNYTLTTPAGTVNKAIKDLGQTYATYTSAHNVISNKSSLQFLTDQNGNSVGAYGTDDTILLVLDNDNDVTVYEGVKKMPSVKATGRVTVGYLVEGAYIRYAFIDGSGNSTFEVDGGAKNEDLMFVLKKGNSGSNTSKNERYVEYDVVLNGESKKIKIEEGFAGTASLGNGNHKLYTNLKYNSDGWVTNATEVGIGVSAKEYSSAANGKNVVKGRIGITGNTLSLNGVELNVSGASVNLIIQNGTTGTTGQGDNTDYVGQTGSAVAGRVKNYVLSYSWYATYSEDHATNGSGKVKAVYIYVTYGKKATDEYAGSTTVTDANTLFGYIANPGSLPNKGDDGSALQTVIFDGDLTVPFGKNIDLSGLGKDLVILGNLINESAALTIATDSVDVKGAVINNTGAQITVTTPGSLACEGATNYGTVYINGNLKATGEWVELSPTSLHINSGTVDLDGGLTVSGSGKVVVGDAGSKNATVNIAGLTVNGDSAIVTITEATSVTVTDAATVTKGTVTIADEVTFDELTIASGVTVAVSADVNVEDLVLNGTITLTNADLTITEGGSVTGNNGTITASGTSNVVKEGNVDDDSAGNITVSGTTSNDLGSYKGTITISGVTATGATGTGVTYDSSTYAISVDATAGTISITVDEALSDVSPATTTVNGVGLTIALDNTDTTNKTIKITLTNASSATGDWKVTITATKATAGS